MQNQPKLFLIDTLALIYRAHFALHKTSQRNSKGLAVGALLGFANTLVELLDKNTPTHVVAALDTPQPTWRKELYPLYKAQRDIQPEDITTAIPYSKKLLAGFGIPTITLPGYEADDLIGTLALQAQKEGYDVYIVSLDKDFGQLVDHHISLYRPARKGIPAAIWTIPEVLAHWQIKRIDHIPDILGLAGDTADNIPGVPQIGPKTAQKLVNTFGTIQEIFAQNDTLAPKIRAKLLPYQAQALLSKALATITTDAPIQLDLTAHPYQGPNKDYLVPLLAELEFRALTKRLFPDISLNNLPLWGAKTSTLAAGSPTLAAPYATYATKQPHYTALKDPQAIDSLVAKIAKAPSFAFDTETTSLDPYRARLLGIALAYLPEEAFFIPMPPTKEGVRQCLKRLEPIFHHPTILKIGQNLKYDLLVLRQYDYFVSTPFFDTMLAHQLIEPGTKHNLSSLAKQYLAYAPIEIETLIGEKSTQQLTLDQVPEDQVLIYACEDADITFQIYQKVSPELVQKEVDRLFYSLEMKLLPVLVHMEHIGIAIDTSLLAQVSTSLAKELVQVEAKIYDHAGLTFNIASPKQLGQILFEHLKIADYPSKTATGQYATHETALRKLIDKHPIIPDILLFREIKKLRSTYVDALPKLLGPDKRLHTSYHQGIASTGRLSSTHPNLQNIPIRTERGKAIRKAFVPAYDNYLLLAADYSQIELRIIAHFAKEKRMIAAFQAGQDIHTTTAAEIFHVLPEEVTPDMRRKAKMVGFGIIYGISSFGLSQRLGIPRTEASQIIQAYFQKFPAIKAYIEQTIASAKTQGYATTLLGRKRFLPEINSKNAAMRGFAERNAINMPIQGSAAELIQLAMIDIHAWIMDNQLPIKMVLQVHDELLFEVDRSILPAAVQGIRQRMSNALPLDLPIEVTIGTGKDWLEAH